MAEKVNLEFLMTHAELFYVCDNCGAIYLVAEKCPDCRAECPLKIDLISVQGLLSRAALDELFVVEGEE